MTAKFSDVPTTVPIDGGQAVTIDPGQPWPSAYRGSQYSLVSDDDYDDGTLKWEVKGLQIFTDTPPGLRRFITGLGKPDGLGSLRITADGQVLTKIPADDYVHVEQAPVDEGWIPVYLGTLSGPFDFQDIELDPPAPESGVKVWPGLPFQHGERWSVTHDGRLVWRWRGYEFEPVGNHSELAAHYQSFRPTGGRIYVNEHGHVWGNISHEDVPGPKANDVRQAVTTWKQAAEDDGNATTLQLINRRLKVTGGGDPSDGLLPMHLGHLTDFDNGAVPTPVVDEPSYYAVVGRYEQVWE